MNTPKPLWLLLAPAIFLVLWSMGFSVAKIGLQFTDPMTLLALRFGCVVVIMVVLFAVLRPPLPTTGADWGHLAVVGILIQSVYFGFTYFAFESGVGAGTVALLMSFQPIVVAMIAPRWTGERVVRRQWLGLWLGLIGAVVVILAQSQIASPTVAGLVFCALALAGITAGSLWEKRFGLNHHPVTATLVGYSAGLIGILPFLALQEIRIDWTWTFGAALAYLVLANSVVAIGLLLAMIRAGDVARVSALFFLVPPLAAVVAIFMLGEPMPGLAWVGMALAAMGVYLATRSASAA